MRPPERSICSLPPACPASAEAPIGALFAHPAKARYRAPVLGGLTVALSQYPVPITVPIGIDNCEVLTGRRAGKRHCTAQTAACDPSARATTVISAVRSSTHLRVVTLGAALRE
jgi:hypothetical protein